jgi:phospholipase/lecithinase/hemolysin
MRKSIFILMIVAFVGLMSMSAKAATPSYTSLYVFGDSYCDVGNLFTATSDTYPPPYYNGRFSNGPIWLDHVAGYLDVPMKASLLGGTNYAFGGAWVTAPQPITGGVIPSVPEQVGLYLSQHGGKADPNALYIIEGGGNDIVGTSLGSPGALGYQIAVGIADSELMLRRAGARHFVIPDLFNVGLLPVAASNATFAAAASSAANKWLNTLLGFEQQLQGIHIIRLDVFSLMNAVQTDPTHFGFTDVKDPCLTTSLCADPEHTYFWDTYHPTVFGHAFFAVTIENALAQQDK